MIEHPKQFAESRLKINRAYRHIQEIESIFQGFLQTDFCQIGVEEDINAGGYVLKIKSVSSIPPGISLCIGDAVHNLRSSFDYVTTRIIGINDNRITFPVATKREDLVSARSFRTVQEAAPEFAIHILDGIKPYQGGDFLIWELTQLDNFDKHKLLVPTLSIHRISGICAEDENNNRLIDGTATVSAGGHINLIGTESRMKITSHGKPAAAILFPKGALFENQPVVPTLMQLLHFAAKAIESLEAFCFGNVPDPNPIPT